MADYKKNLFTSNRTIKKLNMEQSHSIWADDKHKCKQLSALVKLEQLVCRTNFKIMIVEDDPIQLSLLSNLMKEYMFTNVTVSNSYNYKVMQELSKHDSHLIISDNNLGDKLNGIDVFNSVGKDKVRPMFIMLSGGGIDELPSASREGFHYIQKPYKSEDLMKVVHRIYTKFLEKILRSKLK